MSKILNVLMVLVVLGYIGYHFYKKPKYSNGEKANPIQATLMDGSKFDLEDLKGQYVLLDFWGSWCGPCRRENPDLVKLYDKYNGGEFSSATGFEIVSIGVETKESRWKAAIEKDGLKWKYHIAQMDRFKSPIVSQYGVKEIPTKYLINEKGEIIGVNQPIAEIDQMLSRRLKQS